MKELDDMVLDDDGNIIIEKDEIQYLLIPDWYAHYFMR